MGSGSAVNADSWRESIGVAVARRARESDETKVVRRRL